MPAFFNRVVPLIVLGALALDALGLSALGAPDGPPASTKEAAKHPRPGPPNPVSREKLEASIQKGIEFLLRSQNKDGSWGSARRTKNLNIFAPVPGAHDGFRSATTALGISAIIESGASDKQPAAKAALARAEEWLLVNLPKVRRADGVAIYNVWAHAYGIHALVDMHLRSGPDSARATQVQQIITNQIGYLRRYESVDGGWGYYDFRVGSMRPASDSTSFVNASALIAMHEAKQAGVSVPEDLVKRAVDATVRQRKNDFSYEYGEYLKMSPMMPINRPGGSLGRSQACNLALRLWGDKAVTDAVMIEWLDRLIARNGWLSIGRKRPVPHESWFQVAGYFYYYGHYYAALCIEYLGGERMNFYRDHLANLLMPLQEKDGSWFDYELYDYHQQYGTAFAVMALASCRH